MLHYTWKIVHETIKVILKFDLLKISNKDFVWHSNRSFRYLPESIDSEFRRMMASRSGENVNSPCDINEDSFAHVRCSGTGHKGSSRFILGGTERCAYVSRKTHQASRSTHAGIACYSSPKQYTRMLPVAHEQRTRMMFLKSLTDIITLTTHVQIFRTFRRSNRTIFKIFPFVARMICIRWNQHMYRMYQVLRMYTICSKYKLTALCTIFINNFRTALHY